MYEINPVFRRLKCGKCMRDGSRRGERVHQGSGQRRSTQYPVAPGFPYTRPQNTRLRDEYGKSRISAHAIREGLDHVEAPAVRPQTWEECSERPRSVAYVRRKHSVWTCARCWAECGLAVIWPNPSHVPKPVDEGARPEDIMGVRIAFRNLRPTRQTCDAPTGGCGHGRRLLKTIASNTS